MTVQGPAYAVTASARGAAQVGAEQAGRKFPPLYVICYSDDPVPLVEGSHGTLALGGPFSFFNEGIVFHCLHLFLTPFSLAGVTVSPKPLGVSFFKKNHLPTGILMCMLQSNHAHFVTNGTASADRICALEQ